jgi:DNA-binding IclR family transcriptional regulator
VTLGIADGDACLTVAQVDGPNVVACPDWTGRTTPLHCVASGKVLLAAMAERDVLRITRPGLPARTARTITGLEALLEELARVRRRGYATAFSEWIEGTNGVAVPVADARGRVIASIGVWGPAFRVTAGASARSSRAPGGRRSGRSPRWGRPMPFGQRPPHTPFADWRPWSSSSTTRWPSGDLGGGSRSP